MEPFYVDVVSYTQSVNTQRFGIYEISALSRFFFTPCWYVISFTQAVKTVGFSIDVYNVGCFAYLRLPGYTLN